MKLSRRELIQFGALATGSSFWPSLLPAEGIAFDSRFPSSIMSADLKDNQGHLQLLSGEIPKDLFGHLFIMEGIPLEENHFSPAAKGAITRIDFFENNSIPFTRRMIRTPEVIMQDNLKEGFDQFRLLGGMVYFSPTLGFMNYCNTVPIPMGDNRFCLGFEGGVPYEFDAHSLDIITPIGAPSEWITSLPAFASKLTSHRWLFPQVRGTAHAYFDHRTGESFMHNFGGNIGGIGQGFLRIVKWDGKGKLLAQNVKGRDGKAAYLLGSGHSLGVTKNFIVIFDTATRVEGQRMIGIRNIEPQPHEMNVWVIKRADLDNKQDWVTADKIVLGFDTSDIMVDYDDFDGVITMYGQYLSASDKSEPIYSNEKLLFGGKARPEHSGYPIAPIDVGGLVRAAVQVTPQGIREVKEVFHVTRDAELTWDMNDPAHSDQYQFPDRFEHIYWAAVGYRPEHVVSRAASAYKNYENRQFTNATLPRKAIGSAILHQDCQSMAIVDSFQFPSHMVMRTPQFMKKKGDSTNGPTNGYIACAVVVNTAFEADASLHGKEIWIFDAQNLKQGPLCRLHSPDLNFATTNHALWVESIGTSKPNTYKADIYSHYEAKLSHQSKRVVSIVKNEILPRFL